MAWTIKWLFRFRYCLRVSTDWAKLRPSDSKKLLHDMAAAGAFWNGCPFWVSPEDEGLDTLVLEACATGPKLWVLPVVFTTFLF